MNYCIERKIGSTKIECLICEIELWGSAYLHDNAEKAWNIFLRLRALFLEGVYAIMSH